MNRRNLFRFRRHNIINEQINEQNFESYPLNIEKNIKRKKKFSNLKKNFFLGSIIIIPIFALVIIIIYFFIFIPKRKKNSNFKEYINKPFLPSNIDDKPEKKISQDKI